MQHENSIIINKPLKEVVRLFENENNLYEWHANLKKIKPITGKKRQTGYEAIMVYEIQGRSFELQEKVVLNNLPEQFISEHLHQGVYNRVEHCFEAETEEVTRWTTVNTLELRGWKKIFGIFMKSNMKSTALQTARAFKAFAESK
ncbi:SRPBCC family protein [Persicobacter psychrovividus]|uniref:SRPBCC family protein n=1 Tax=Persicobacter psychrovividus TaxID=387638 RepID=A0ABM7VL81_9BACT|nr:hypothetical protein PEPS_40350 [Persicobacter psychrovividus]